MKDVTPRLGLPALIGLGLVLPFILLEAINTRGFGQGFPLALFATQWLLPTAFILIGVKIVRNVRAGNSLLSNPATLLLRVAGLALIVWVWGSIVADQMPCFLGVPNCD